MYVDDALKLLCVFVYGTSLTSNTFISDNFISSFIFVLVCLSLAVNERKSLPYDIPTISYHCHDSSIIYLLYAHMYSYFFGVSICICFVDKITIRFFIQFSHKIQFKLHSLLHFHYTSTSSSPDVVEPQHFQVDRFQVLFCMPPSFFLTFFSLSFASFLCRSDCSM